MIDMTKIQAVLRDAQDLAVDLHGEELDERDATSSPKGGVAKGEARRRRAELSQNLQFLAARLEMAAALARNEYWYARGEVDALDPDRDD